MEMFLLTKYFMYLSIHFTLFYVELIQLFLQITKLISKQDLLQSNFKIALAVVF